jgi:hypothetical protein
LKVRAALVVVLLILVAVFLMLRYGTGRRGGEEPLFADFAPDRTARIVMEGPDTTATLARADGVWFVTSEDSFPAEPVALDQMFDNITGFSRKDIISSNPEKQALYEVDSTGVFVTLSDATGDTLVRFVVGKPGPDYQSTYVRDVETNDVILAPGYLRPVFDRGKRTWQDRTIFALEPDAIIEVEVRRPGGTLTLRRDGAGGWLITRPESTACDPGRVTRFLRTLAYLRCDEFAGRMPVAGSGLTEADSSIAFNTLDGRREQLLFGATTEKQRTFARREGSEIVYLLATHQVNAILPGISDLRAPEIEPGVGTGTGQGR